MSPAVAPWTFRHDNKKYVGADVATCLGLPYGYLRARG